ncbi:MAG: putative YigZ family protein [Myxococcota bacterium]|jgi:uncharacterized YigZ family protein
MASYLTVSSAFEYVAEPIKGSRFVALISPVPDADMALGKVEEARMRWPGATHHCWAFRLRDGTSRSSDDGEPGGSAGRPILAMIDGHDVADVCIVVVRWYGGTKLGVGGLMRAYGGTAGKGLDASPIEEVIETADFWVGHAYDDTNAIATVVSSYDVVVVETAYTDTVRTRLRVVLSAKETVEQALVNATSGRVQLIES